MLTNGCTTANSSSWFRSRCVGKDERKSTLMPNLEYSQQIFLALFCFFDQLSSQLSYWIVFTLWFCRSRWCISHGCIRICLYQNHQKKNSSYIFSSQRAFATLLCQDTFLDRFGSIPKHQSLCRHHQLDLS